MTRAISYLVHQSILGAIRPGRMRWIWPIIPRIGFEWHGWKKDMGPIKIRWGLVLILALVLFLLMGECGPSAASPIAMAW